MNECTQERFLRDVEDHSMEVLRDDGDCTRHLSFTEDGSSVYRFDLITWPGCLCITGDCGTYVFNRIRDMFDFFIMGDNDFNKKNIINPGYWGEKLESIDRHGGYEEFDPGEFEKQVRSHFDMHWDHESDSEARGACWEQIEDNVLCYGNDEHQSYQAIHNFEHDGFEFQDFFDGGGTERYTFHYIWCLYAIVYGITEYNKLKQANAA